MAPLPFATVTKESELNTDLAAIAGGTKSYTITFGGGITLDTDLLAVNLGAGGSLTLQGAGNTIDGANRFRGLFDYSGTLIVDNLTIANARASGGNGGEGANVGGPNAGGGGGGGGAGLGGGLFVASAGKTTLNNVTFTNDSAVGGNGGGGIGPMSKGNGGGGGMGGNGGNGFQTRSGGFTLFFGGSGGGIGVNATGGLLNPGGPGLIPTGAETRIGNGGGKGIGENGYIATGGGVGSLGADGGFGGGGAGAAGFAPNGGPGGFGGGGGAGSSSGGIGGFGGGGGGGSIVTAGGFGAGNGGSKGDLAGGGGGGLGAGADIFVQQGGQLTIGVVGLNAGSVTGGSPGFQVGGIGPGITLPNPGQAFGNGIFIQGNQPIFFAPPSGVTTTISSIIADMNGSIAGSGGAGSVVMNGLGTLKLAIAEPYTGGTIIGNGTVELVTPTAAGTGNIHFGDVAPGGPAVLQIDTPEQPTNLITGLGTGDTIDLRALPFVAGATAKIANNKLTVTSGGKTVTLNAQPADAALTATPDGSGGTDVSLFFPVITSEQQLNADIASIAGTTTAQKFTIGESFHLTDPLQAINLGVGGSLTIDGGGFALGGNGMNPPEPLRGLIVYSGNVTINNLGLDGMRAQGGRGGFAANPGGGGAGLGGGLLIASGGAVTLNNVTFSNDSASGGSGGDFLNFGVAGGGGGGLGGPGGDGIRGGPLDFTSDGGGGGVGSFFTGRGGTKGVNDGKGEAGLVPGAASGGSGGQGTPGGMNGGGGGDAGHGDGGGGGIDGQAGNSAGNNFGGNGGWGGGGGGGGSGLFDKTNGGGSGGFGGGAGGAANPDHKGGFGGGGGGGGDSPGVAGVGGGNGGGKDYGGGGGGAGLGADIFVQQGGKLTIIGGTLGAGIVQAGGGGRGRAPENGGKPGSAAGTTVFEQGNQAITFAPNSGQTLTVQGGIADENSISPGAGAGSVVVDGAGTVKLVANDSYSGGTSLQSGTLELVTGGAAGTGAIAFGGGSATLQLDYVVPEETTISQPIQGLGSGVSRIYLPNVSVQGITFESDTGTRLTFKAGNTTYTFSDLGETAGDTINAADIVADKSGRGVDIVATRVPGGNVPPPANDAGTAGETVTSSDLSAGLAFNSSSPSFLGGSTAPSIDDRASGVAMNGGTDIFQPVGNEPSTVADLTGGVTEAAGVMSVLTSDGMGAPLTASGVGQSVDPLVVAASALHAGNLQIGWAA